MRINIEILEQRIIKRSRKFKLDIKIYLSQRDIGRSINLAKVVKRAKKHNFEVWYSNTEKLVFRHKLEFMVPIKESISWNKLNKKLKESHTNIIDEILKGV